MISNSSRQSSFIIPRILCVLFYLQFGMLKDLRCVLIFAFYFS
jgi:hypothetical protein